MTYLSLNTNDLVGKLPFSYRFPNLIYATFELNTFTGVVPDALCSDSLTYLTAYSNSFTCYADCLSNIDVIWGTEINPNFCVNPTVTPTLNPVLNPTLRPGKNPSIASRLSNKPSYKPSFTPNRSIKSNTIVPTTKTYVRGIHKPSLSPTLY